MKRVSIPGLMIVLFAVQLACNMPTPQPEQANTPIPVASPTVATTPSPVETAPPVPTLTDTPAAATPQPAQINLESLKNFTYWVQDFNLQVTLTNGEFNNGEIQSRLVEPAAQGDLNGDGQADAAVVLTVDPSGSGTFYYLIVLLNQGGTPVQAAMTSIGDRQVVNDLRIEEGRVVLDYLTQGLSGPLCCPSERRLRSYLLDNNALRLASEQILVNPTDPAVALPNAILIDQPVDSDPITRPLRVSGRVSQVPPERKLAYYVIDFEATLLVDGEVTVEGEPGGPGTFSFEIIVEGAVPGLAQLEVIDAANGILRGRSTVVLISR